MINFLKEWEEAEKIMLKTELKKIIGSPQYLICVAILFVLLMIGTTGFWADTLMTGETVSMLVHFWNAWDFFGRVYIVVPLLVTVPITFLLHDELNSGYLYFSLHRAGKGRYVMIKMIAGILSGILMIFLAELLFTVLLIILTPGEINFTDQQNVLDENSTNFYLNLIRDGNGWIVYGIWSLLACLYGGVFSAIAVATSVLARNKYVATIVPFIVFLLAENLMFRFGFLPLVLRASFENIFYPAFRRYWMCGIPISLTCALIWIIGSLILFWYVICRKIKGKI